MAHYPVGRRDEVVFSRDLQTFLGAVRKHGWEMLGFLICGTAATAFGFNMKEAPAWICAGIGAFCLGVAVFRAWCEQYHRANSLQLALDAKTKEEETTKALNELADYLLKIEARIRYLDDKWPYQLEEAGEEIGFNENLITKELIDGVSKKLKHFGDVEAALFDSTIGFQQTEPRGLITENIRKLHHHVEGLRFFHGKLAEFLNLRRITPPVGSPSSPSLQSPQSTKRDPSTPPPSRE